MRNVNFLNVKSKLVLATFLLLGITTLISSCKKEDEPTVDTKPTVKKETLTTQDKINFFNKLGEEHNKVLDYVADNISIRSNNQEDRFYIASGYFKGCSNITYETITGILDTANLVYENPSSIGQYLPEKISPEIKVYFDSLFLIYEKVKNNLLDSIITTPTEFNCMITRLENQIYSKFKVNLDTTYKAGDDAALLLGTCAIARYSYQYWYNAAVIEGNPWNEYLSGNFEKMPKWLKKLWHGVKVVAADVCGFLTHGWEIDFTSKQVTAKWNLDEAFKGASGCSSSV